MSDSEEDLISNPFRYQNDIMVVNAKGPNISTGNMSFRNHLSSTLQLPPTFAPRYANSCYDPRTRYREQSPMSVASACDARYRNLNNNNSQYRGMGSQRSVYNERSGSPMSARTIDSTSSLRATEIAMALKHVKFNKYEMSIIKEAYNSLMKKKSRRKIEKRRNLKLGIRCNRRRSGYDSGEQASNSSLSSDDGRSVRTGFEENMSSCRSTDTHFVAEMKKTIKEGIIYKDCSENFRHNSLRKIVNRPADLTNTQTSSSSMWKPSHSFHAPQLKSKSSTQSLPDQNTRITHKQYDGTSSMRIPSHSFQAPRLNSSSIHTFQTQKERFQNGYVLPSQRFNKSTVPEPITEISHTQNNDTDSDCDIFSTNKNKQTNNDNRKRNISEADVVLPNNKRPKGLSPCKNSVAAKKATKETNKEETENRNDFDFAKPMMPVRKFKEKLISKSLPPLPEIVKEPPTKKRFSNETKEIENETTDLTNVTDTSDVSMRPSFIKRKLFTQKMDVTESKNQNTDNINSPQNSIYSAIQKEKHKARKLVTNQSCLSRDIGDDNNLLDLIHKIVPANSLNVTTQSNANKTSINHNKSIDSDKFDVTSIITAKNGDDDVSETFTDEEILHTDYTNTIKNAPKEKSKQNSVKNSKINPNPKAAKTKNAEKSKVNEVDKVKKTPVKEKVNEPIGNFKTKNCVVSLKKTPIAKVQPILEKNDVNKTKPWSTFWDLDSESDIESINPKRTQLKDSTSESINEQIKNTTIAKGIGTIFKNPSVATTMSAFDTTQRLNITGLKIRSHRSPKLKKCCDEIKENTIKSYFPTSVRKNHDTSIQIDHNKPEDNAVQKPNTLKNVKTQKDSKPAEHKNPTEQKQTKKIKKTPIKDKPKIKTPKKRGRQPKSETRNKTASDKIEKTPVKENAKDKGTNNSEGKPKNGQIKPLTTRVNEQNTNFTEKQKKNEAKKKTTPKKRTRPQKSETLNKTVSDKIEQVKENTNKIPVKENAKDKGADNSKGKSKNGQIKPLKNNLKENHKPNTEQSNTKLKQQDNIEIHNKNTRKIQLDSSVTNSSLENDNSKVIRAIRSCRISKNSTINSSKDSFNLTMTLRSRNVDLSMNKSGMKLNMPVKENRSKRIR